jgi:hypothetical protein
VPTVVAPTVAFASFRFYTSSREQRHGLNDGPSSVAGIKVEPRHAAEQDPPGVTLTNEHCSEPSPERLLVSAALSVAQHQEHRHPGHNLELHGEVPASMPKADIVDGGRPPSLAWQTGAPGPDSGWL